MHLCSPRVRCIFFVWYRQSLLLLFASSQFAVVMCVCCQTEKHLYSINASFFWVDCNSLFDIIFFLPFSSFSASFRLVWFSIYIIFFFFIVHFVWFKIFLGILALSVVSFSVFVETSNCDCIASIDLIGIFVYTFFVSIFRLRRSTVGGRSPSFIKIRIIRSNCDSCQPLALQFSMRKKK